MPKPTELNSEGVTLPVDKERKQKENVEYREAVFNLLERTIEGIKKQYRGQTVTTPGLVPPVILVREPISELSIGGFVFDKETIHPLVFVGSSIYALGGKELKCLFPAKLLQDPKWRPGKSRLLYEKNAGVEVQWGKELLKQYWGMPLAPSSFFTTPSFPVSFAFEVFTKPSKEREHVIFLSREFQEPKGSVDKEKFRQECDRIIGDCYQQMLQGLIGAGGFERGS